MQVTPKEGISDARQLGYPKYAVLGIQHLFAMFQPCCLLVLVRWFSILSASSKFRHFSAPHLLSSVAIFR